MPITGAGIHPTEVQLHTKTVYHRRLSGSLKNTDLYGEESGITMIRCILSSGRSFLVLFVLLLTVPEAPHLSVNRVKSGLDVLEEENFVRLKNRRVAVVANRTAVNKNRKGIIPLLKEHGVTVVTIFSPEHGFSAAKDSKVSDSELDGIPVVSLYGKRKKMDPDELEGIDICLFDIQSVGARYYTYIATMVYTMQACAHSNTQCIILDRPNPAGGTIVSGFMPDKGNSGKFTSIYPIPIRHGMTLGELANMFNKEHAINCRLTVIKMRGWKRKMIFSDTHLPWTNPSPNIQSEEAAILYTGIGWLETTALSMGRGTPEAFEILGAPYINGGKLAESLRHVKGFTIKPVQFTPKAQYHKFYGTECGGISITMRNKKNADSFALALEIYKHLAQHYPKQFRDYGGLPVSSGKNRLRAYLSKNSVNSVLQSVDKELKPFMKTREKYLLYRD